MKQKLEIYNVFCNLKVLVENLFNCKIKMFQSDRGKEFDQTSMHALFLKTVPIFTSPAQTHNNKMELQNENIIIFLR